MASGTVWNTKHALAWSAGIVRAKIRSARTSAHVYFHQEEIHHVLWSMKTMRLRMLHKSLLCRSNSFKGVAEKSKLEKWTACMHRSVNGSISTCSGESNAPGFHHNGANSLSALSETDKTRSSRCACNWQLLGIEPSDISDICVDLIRLHNEPVAAMQVDSDTAVIEIIHLATIYARNNRVAVSPSLDWRRYTCMKNLATTCIT